MSQRCVPFEIIPHRFISVFRPSCHVRRQVAHMARALLRSPDPVQIEACVGVWHMPATDPHADRVSTCARRQGWIWC